MSKKPNQCCKRVYAGSFVGHLCTKPAKHEHEGRLYCSIHYPPHVAEKRAATDAKWDKEWQEKQEVIERIDKARAEQKRRADCFPDLLAALQSVISEHQNGYGLQCEEQVRAAIDKATGAAS